MADRDKAIDALDDLEKVFGEGLTPHGWEMFDTIRQALTPQSSADMERVREALVKANAFCQGESSYTAYPEIQEALRILDEVIGRAE